MLDRQKIVVPLAEGVDTKTDPKQVAVGKHLDLQNAVFTKIKSFQTRDGNVSLGKNILNGSAVSVSNGVALATFSNELLLADGERFYSYDQANDGWLNKSAYIPALVTASSVCKDTYNQTHADGATAVSGLQLYAWEDSSAAGSVRYSVIDSQTQQTVVPSTLLSSNGVKPRVLLGESQFFVYYVDLGVSALMLARIPYNAPTVSPQFVQITSNGAVNDAISSTAPNYDAVVYAPTVSTQAIAVAFNNNNGGTTVRKYSISDPVLASQQAVIAHSSRDICVFGGNFSSVVGLTLEAPFVVFATDNGSLPYTASIRFVAYDDTMTPIGADVIASGLAYYQARAITAVNNSASNSIGFEVYYSDCDTYPASTSKAVVTQSFGVQTPVVWQRRVAPIGKAFRYNGRNYLPTVFFFPGQAANTPNLTLSGTTALQSLYFLMDEDGNVIGKAFSGSLAANAPCAYTPPVLGTVSSVSVSNGIAFLSSKTDVANFSVGQAVQSRTNGVMTQTGGVAGNVFYVINTDAVAGSVTLSDTLGGSPYLGQIYAGDVLYPVTLANVSGQMLPGVTAIDASTFRYAMLDQVLIQGSLTETQTNVSQVTFNLTAPYNDVHKETLANNLHLTGGALQMYDGAAVVEHGFHLYPIFTISNAYATTGTGLTVGSYYYTVCYEWVDNQGNIHQSQPADPIQITHADTFKVELQINYLNQTAKVGSRPVQIVVYRSMEGKTNGAQLLFRISSLTAPDINDVAGTTLTYTDSTPDSALATIKADGTVVAAKPLLYAQIIANPPAGEIVNQPAPSTALVQLHRNRLWVVDSTQPLNLWYSKLIGPATPVAFSDEQVKTVDPRGGSITALATLDDKLLVFKADRIFYILGQGPDNAGNSNDLSDAILITADAGCIDSRSVVLTPMGVMFKSRKGIYLIDRSMAVQYIGAPVEAFNADTITSAVLVTKTNQVRFTLSSGSTLVFDYFVQQWGTFTNSDAVDSLIWQDDTLLLRANGTVLQETAGVYRDDGQPISLKLETAWFSFAQVQGFQRVRRAELLGAWKSPHQLKISVCYDFNDTVVQEVIVNPTSPTTFGGASPYGAGSYGGEFQLYQWRIDLARQKCQAVKFIVESMPSVTGSGEGVSLSSLAFEVGAKQGLNKVPASQIVS
jgi:hypothetical protein